MSVSCVLVTFAALCLVEAFGNNDIVQFEKFMTQFNKSYDSMKEFKYRLHIFKKNMEQARLLQEAELGTALYGVTKFSDLTDQEFSTYHYSKEYTMPPSSTEEMEVTILPKCDWRKSSVIYEVRDQGEQCKASWAFAAVANIEAQWRIKGLNTTLSVQRLIDCNICGDGCIRGNQWHAYRTVLYERLAEEVNYKYQGRKNYCNRNVTANWWISDFEMLPRSETAMSFHLSYKGTLTVAINDAPLKLYKGGVIDQLHCNKSVGDHVAHIVGYVKEKNKPYWILQNSWGKDWGENGYFRLLWGKNICGITNYPLSAIVDYKTKLKIKCPV